MTGPGGTGKTRLALQIGASVLADYPDGVFLVELETVQSAEGVVPTLLSAVGAPPTPDLPPMAALTQHIREAELLLILDNCEHVVATVAQVVAGILRYCPGVHLLATSREALSTAGEVVWPVPPLGLPDMEALPPAEELSMYESVRLFVDRAIAADPHFHVDNESAPAIAEICYRLDGIPTAIELAAARIKVLSAKQIAERLSDRFRLLTGHSRTLLPRQQTLRALVDWSHGLLTPPEQALWRRMSIFPAGCTLEAAEAVCAFGGIESYEVLDLVSQLIDKSIAYRSGDGDETRYLMLETLRAYGAERLEDSGDAAEVRRRFVAFADHKSLEISRHLEGERSSVGLAEVFAKAKVHYPTLVAAAAMAVAQGDVAAAGRIAVLASGFAMGNLRGGEVAGLLRSIVELPCEQPDEYYAGCLINYGTLLMQDAADRERARATLEEGIAIARSLGSAAWQAAGVNNLGVLLGELGDDAGAAKAYAEAYALSTTQSALPLVNLAQVEGRLGDQDVAQQHAREAEARAMADGDRRSVGAVKLLLALWALLGGSPEEALPLLHEANRLNGDLDLQLSREITVVEVAVLSRLGQPEDALALLSRFAERDLVNGRLIAIAELPWAAMGRYREAARLAGLRRSERYGLEKELLSLVTACEEEGRSRMGERAWAEAADQSAALPADTRRQEVRSLLRPPKLGGVDDEVPGENPKPLSATPAPMKAHSVRKASGADADALSLMQRMERLSLRELTVIGAYRRYDERVRNQLRDWQRRIAAPVLASTRTHDNFLIWAAPGSGKSFLIQETSRSLAGDVRYLELNLARLPKDAFLAGLSEVRDCERPLICMLDEIDARGDEDWPYEEAFSLLDLNLREDRQAAFVLVGSHPKGLKAMVESVAARRKGKDMLDRVPVGNRFEIPAPTLGDRAVIVATQVVEAAALRGEPVEEVEKLALYYALCDPALETPRQLRDLAVAAVQNLPSGDRRLKYDDLFFRGDGRNQAFWMAHREAAEELSQLYVRISAV